VLFHYSRGHRAKDPHISSVQPTEFLTSMNKVEASF
jgi:hypothetical protein